MFKLTLAPQNIEVLLPANSSLTELEFELHGHDSVVFGCRSGACGACVIEVIRGADALGQRLLPETTFLETLGYVGEQFRLACQCRIGADATICVAGARC